MAYSTSNPPACVTQKTGSSTGGDIWVYVSADAMSTVRAADYFTDALALGMKALDVVLVVDTASPAVTWAVVLTVDGDGADLTDGSAIDMTNS
jgi:hypothetical protein